MATKTLFEKIRRLPPRKRAKVEEFVESLADPEEPLFPRGLLHQIRRDHKALVKEHVSIDTDDLLRELRADGGR
jgi:hypothetical protein